MYREKYVYARVQVILILQFAQPLLIYTKQDQFEIQQSGQSSGTALHFSEFFTAVYTLPLLDLVNSSHGDIYMPC